MRVLNVTMLGDASESRMLALPFDVYGPSGEPLGRGVVSTAAPAKIWLNREANYLPRVHVVAVRPDGKQLQASADLRGGPNAATGVTLEAGARSPQEWLQWVTPFRSLDHLNTPASSSSSDRRRRVGSVWVTLWRLQDGQWQATDTDPQAQLRSDGARMIVLDVPSEPHLLQVGGDEVAWRLVSLPPGGQVRVALTRRAAESGDTIDVTVGRQNPGNDLIMSYLSRGEAVQAESLAEAWRAADLALYAKRHDPISAAAGAYVLLKMGRLEQRWTWVENLVNWFEYLADGPIVAAAMELRRPQTDIRRVRFFIAKAMERGLPVFSMGLYTLVETMAAIHRGKRESMVFQAQFQAARSFLQAQASKGAYLSFYGRSPVDPSPVRVFGSAGKPRRKNVSYRLGNGFNRPPRRFGGVYSPFIGFATTALRHSKDLQRLGMVKQYDRLAKDEFRVQLVRESRSSRNGFDEQRLRKATQVFLSDE
ncbi:hypothetical protein [Xanthomonas campestris]|uniref:hypothetical protein n=1 Tax=Xanthomonas campestris TaxID=339 RepID=UPI00021AFB37|nr:hypothetical protein [Xanthomonas campestris]AEL07777.1 conserved hypothetical protein [Xanthomonas campestris pv. raphani 756C]MEA9773860.1 hypothetical protein [Xanthomonas campestris pv. raphani]MEA9917572.1 hypothetical protein [Xanthomonas campestris pv. raphani]